MLVRIIKGRDLLELLSHKEVKATTSSTGSLDIDPNGNSIIAEDILGTNYHLLHLLVKVCKDNNPRFVALHISNSDYEKYLKDEYMWVEPPSSNTVNV